MEDLKFVLDIGNSYIKGILFGKENGRSLIIAKEIEKTQGIRKGKIIDINDFGKSILTLIENVEKKIGDNIIHSVYVGVSHPKMVIKTFNETKRIINGIIKEEDIAHFEKVIYDISEENYEIIKTIPTIWIIDDDIKVKDPLGYSGKKLELIADVFMLPKDFYNSLIETFNKIQIDIEDIIPNILGASEVVLESEQKDLGSMLVDIGSNQTTFVVYDDMIPIHYGVLPYGGEDVTKDISIGLQIDIKQAENIKKEKGIIILDEYVNDDSVDIKFLSEIISARYEDIFSKIKEELEKIGKIGKLAGGVYLIGGGSKIKNLDFFLKDYLKLYVSYGKDNVLNQGDLSYNLQFINCIGVYIWIEKYMKSFSGKKGISLPSFDFKGIIEKIKNLFKNLF